MSDIPLPPDHDERRRHLRFVPREITVSLVKEQGFLRRFGLKGSNLAGTVLDISEGGLRIIIKKRIPVGSRILMDFQVELLKDRLEIGGHVLWLAVHPHQPDLFIIGVRFDRLTPDQVKMVSNWRTYFNSPQVKQRETSKRIRRREEADSGSK